MRLSELLSLAFTQNQWRGRAEITVEWLLQNNQGLIMLSGAMMGDIGQALLMQNTALARQAAERWQQAFGDRFYLELQRYGQPQQALYESQLLALAQQLDLPVVATQPIQFMRQQD